MHRKKVKLKNYRRHVKNPTLTRSHVAHSSVNSAAAETSPELNKIYHLGMKNLIAQCKLCGKKFISEPYLHAHHERRHYGQPYCPLIVDGSAALLEVEIRYLKHRLSALECQLLKREWQQTFKGKAKVTEDSEDIETEIKKKQPVKEHEEQVVETKAVHTDQKNENADNKINKYEKEIEELKNIFFAQIKELKQASQQAVLYVSNEFVQTEDTVDVPKTDEKEVKEETQQHQQQQQQQQKSQPLPVRNESVQTDITTEDVQEKTSLEDGELQNKLEERESVWRLRLAKADEQHKQELKQIQDRLQQTYKEGNQIKQELEEKLKQTLLKLEALEEENAQLLQKQSCLEEDLASDNRIKVVSTNNRQINSNKQNQKVLNKNKTLLIKTNTTETSINNKPLEVNVEHGYKKETELFTFHKDKEDESDFEISLPDGFKQKQSLYNQQSLSRPKVGNFCEDKVEIVKANEKSTEEQIKSPIKDVRRCKNNVSNIMDFLNETEENVVKIPVKKFNLSIDSSIEKVISDKEPESEDDDLDEEDEDEKETEDKEGKGMLEDLSESGSSYSGSSESEEDSALLENPSQTVFEVKQFIQKPVEDKGVTASNDDLQLLINEMYLQTLESMQKHLIIQPDMLKHIRQDVEEKLRHRLKQLAIDPDWTGLPQATFQNKMALLKHHQNIAAKTKVGYFTQRGQLARDVDTMKRNPKDSGNCKLMQENILGKLKTKVAQVLKAYPKLASRVNHASKTSVEIKPSEVAKQLQQSAVKVVASSPKQQEPIMVQDELLRKELEEMKSLQQSANKLKMYALDEELSESDSLSWSLSSISKDISPGKGTFFHENKMKSAMKNAAASSGNIAKKRVLFAEDARVS